MRTDLIERRPRCELARSVLHTLHIDESYALKTKTKVKRRQFPMNNTELRRERSPKEPFLYIYFLFSDSISLFLVFQSLISKTPL